MALRVPVSIQEDTSRSYAFIDGDYLRGRFNLQMQRFYAHVPAVDFVAVQKRLGGGRTYFYDAVNYQQGKGETKEAFEARVAGREAEHRYISSLAGFHVRNGFVRRGERRKNEQKAVDVQLAVDALEHAARGNMEVASILAGDLDFEPLLRSLERLGVRTRLYYVNGTSSLDLLEAADERQPLTLVDFYGFAAHSFRINHKVLKINQAADLHLGARPFRHGTWQERKVTLYLVQDDTPRLHVAWGDELTEPQFVVEYPEIDKLLAGFELTFGEITWLGPPEAWYANHFASRA